MTTMALDVAYRTGWAGSDGATGSIDLAEHKGDLAWMGLVLASHIDRLIAQHHVTELVIERPFYRAGGTAVYALGGLAFVAHMRARCANVPRREVTAWEVKKWATGDRKAKKPAMVAAARRLGWEPKNDDEADAICILSYWLAKNGQQARAA